MLPTSTTPPVLLLALLLAGCAAPRAASGGLPEGQRTRGFTETRSTAEALEAVFAPRRVALVVGVDEFADPAFPALRWAVADADEIGRILQDPEYGGFDRVAFLTEPSQARRDRILAEMVALRNDLRRQDTLVVFVSTHGTMTIDPEGEPRLFLVAQDTRPGDLRGTAIELAELQRFFSEIRAERKALVLDACYNGQAKSTLQPTVQQRLVRMEEAPVLSRKVRLGESEAHLFASTLGRPAREDDELKHGVYTFHLLDALTWNQLEADTNGDGVISIYEAHDHARKKTLGWTGGAQVPEAYFRMVGSNDVILVGDPEARQKVEVAELYYYGAEGEPLDGATLLVDGQEKGAFPGTFAVTPGRHRIRIVSPEGELLQDRTVRVDAGEAVPADGLRQRPVVHDGFVSFGPKARLSPADSMRALVGRATFGGELSLGYRLPGRLRGLTFSMGLGWTPRMARFVDDDAVRWHWRHVAWGWVGAGYRLALARGQIGAGYRLRGTGLTALEDAACAGNDACDRWFWLTHAIALDQQISLGSRWSLYVEEEFGLTGLDADGAGVRPIPDVGFRIGVEVGI